MQTERSTNSGFSRGGLLVIAASLFVGSVVVTAVTMDEFPQDLLPVVVGVAIGTGLAMFSARQGHIRGETRFAASSLTTVTASLLVQLVTEGEIAGGIAIALAAGTAITVLRPRQQR